MHSTGGRDAARINAARVAAGRCEDVRHAHFIEASERFNRELVKFAADPQS